MGLFFSCGDAALLRRVLLEHGYRDSDLDRELERRMLAYTLLHRFLNLPWDLDRLPDAHGVSTLETLASRWWGLEYGGC